MVHFHYECNARGLDGKVDGNLPLCDIVFGITRNALDGKADCNFKSLGELLQSIRQNTGSASVLCRCVNVNCEPSWEREPLTFLFSGTGQWFRQGK